MDKENFKLNVTDLMVGDWVFCYHPLSSLKARHQVTPEILDLMYRMSVGRLAEDNPTYRIIEPIPLTTQILESTFKIDQTGRGLELERIKRGIVECLFSEDEYINECACWFIHKTDTLEMDMADTIMQQCMFGMVYYA